MNALVSNTLSITNLQPNPRIAALLPSELAHRYHALPVAVDGERITVAMAHPEDADARQAVIDSLGPSTCLVKADEQEIDRLITELWPQNAAPATKILTWFPVDDTRSADRDYAQKVCKLLGGGILPCLGIKTETRFWAWVSETSPENQADLLIFRSPDPPLIKRLLLEHPEKSLIHKFPASLLIVRQPRWPIQQILLVLQYPQIDGSTLAWSIRFAKQSQAAVTILPLLPSPPGVFATMQIRHSIAELLARDYPLGNQLRHSARQLNDLNINSKLRLRNESMDQQIRSEMAEGDYDLIVVGMQSQNMVSRWASARPINDLLDWSDCPLLIVKSLSI